MSISSGWKPNHEGLTQKTSVAVGGIGDASFAGRQNRLVCADSVKMRYLFRWPTKR